MELIKASEIKQHYDTYLDLAAYYAVTDDNELSKVYLNNAQVLAKIIGIDFDTVAGDLQIRTKAKIDNNKHYQKLLTKISAIAWVKSLLVTASVTRKVLEEIEQDYTTMLVDVGRDIGYTLDEINEDIMAELPKDR